MKLFQNWGSGDHTPPVMGIYLGFIWEIPVFMVEKNPLSCSLSPEKLNESQNKDISMISLNTLSLSLESGILKAF